MDGGIVRGPQVLFNGQHIYDFVEAQKAGRIPLDAAQKGIASDSASSSPQRIAIALQADVAD